jgi:L-iditol 2-dehydrogenase
MRALVRTKNEPRSFEIQEVPMPIMSEDDIMIKVLRLGICGSDLHFYKGDINNTQIPIIIGHELCGEIVKIGKNVKGFEVGDTVVFVGWMDTCGLCDDCRSGRSNRCLQRKGLGVNVNGACAEYYAGPAYNAIKVPKGVQIDEAAMIEPACVSADGMLEKGSFKPGYHVGIVGPGPIGIIAAQICRAVGAGGVYVFGTRKDRELRLKLCQEIGFETYEVEDPGVKEQFRDKLDMVVELSSAIAGIDFGIELIKPGGQLIALSVMSDKLHPISWRKIISKSIIMVGSYGSRMSTWKMVIELLKNNAIKLKPLLTHLAPLDDYESVMEDLIASRGIKGMFAFK